MDPATQSPPTLIDVQTSGVSWPAIAAGAAAAAALTLVLVAFGAGLGLSSISPWADSGVSTTTFKVGAGLYLCVTAVMASAIGGYLAARLRTKWTGLHTNEVFFRDTAHGLLAWAFATILTASLLGGATTRIVGGTTQGASAAVAQAAQNNAADVYVDRLFRTDDPTATAPTRSSGDFSATRAEVLRLWTSSLRNGGDLSAADRTYVSKLVAARTGLSAEDAETRLTQVMNEEKSAADKARRAAMQFSFWMTASLLLGAFAASLAAVEGGQLRDGTWNGRVLTPRSI